MSDAIKILITGAGGAATPGLIDALQDQGYCIIATDTDPYAIGLFHADKGYVIPRGDSSEFISAIREICLKENVKAIIPLVDEELIPSFELENNGIIVILPRKEFVETCLDKFILMQALLKAGIHVPKICTRTEDMHFPLIIKPRTGRGSRDIAIIRSMTDYRSFLDSHKGKLFFVQEYISGPEYTVSVVVWRDGEVQTVVPKEIIVKKGITKIGVTRNNPAIDSICREVQDKLKADGPFNVQLKIDERTWEPVIFEINPRFSTTVSLTMAAGIDEVGGILKQALYGRESYHFYDWYENLIMIRGTEHHFMYESEFLARKEGIW